MAWLGVLALLVSVYSGLKGQPWWTAAGFGFVVGYVISIWRLSNSTLRDPFNGGLVPSTGAGYKICLLNGAGVAAFQSVVYFIALAFSR